MASAERVELAEAAPSNDVHVDHDISRTRYLVAFWALVALSAAFRIGYVLIVKRDDPLWTDEAYYSPQAVLVATGDWFADPFSPGEYAATHPPMTAAAMAPVSWLGGDVAVEQRLLMSMYGAAVVAGVGALARLIFTRRISLIATAVAGGYAGLWLNDVMIMSETFAAGTVALILITAYAYQQRRNPGRAALLGLAIGLGGLARAELLVLGAAIGFFVSLGPWTRRAQSMEGVPAINDRFEPSRTYESRERNSGGHNAPTSPGWTRRVGHLGLAGAAAIAVVSPWVVRNQVRFVEPSYMSNGDGGLLLGANCPGAYDGDLVGFWDLSCVLEVTLVPEEDESQDNGRFREVAEEYVQENLDQLPRVMALRVARGTGLYRPDQMSSISLLDGRARPATWIGNVQFWALAALSIFGLRRWPTSLPRWPVIATFVFTILMFALTYGSYRFRIPAEVGLTIGGAVAIDAAFTWFVAQRRRRSTGVGEPGTDRHEERTRLTVEVGGDGT